VWEAVQKEANRRLARDQEKKNRRYFDIELVGGKVLNVEPTPYVTLALSKHNLHQDIKGLHRKPLSWFATYERDWKVVEEAMALGILSVDPKVIEAVEEVLHETRRVITPLYPIKETQRLGYLTDLNVIRCKVSDPVRGFVAGEGYSIVCRTQTSTTTFKKPVQVKKGENAGEWKEAEFEQQRKVLRITIDRSHHFFDSLDHQEDIAYLVKHFELPDPGDVGTRYPVETDFWRDQVRAVEKLVIEHSTAYAEKHPKTKPIEKLRHFQVEDLARFLVKGSGLVAWEQGLGKTIGGSVWAKANILAGRAKDQVLIVAPQDLIPQWQREVKRILGIDLKVIKTHGEAKAVAKYLSDGGTGWYITYYEALAVNGTSKSELLPEIIVETKEDYVKEKWTGRWLDSAIAVKKNEDPTLMHFRAISLEEYREMEYEDKQSVTFVPGQFEKMDRITPPADGNNLWRSYKYVPPLYQRVVKNITSKHICPNCRADRKEGWNGKSCRATNDRGETCNYSHYLHRVKPMGSLLSTAFQMGQVIVDEGTMIQGDYSERSKVVRGIKGRYRLLMTGTPVKNYISQAFWLLSWALGYQNNRWPYGYDDKGKFEENHAVIQWSIVGGKKATRKVLAEVTNLSQLWRLLSSSVVRRRKEETGENLVPKVMHPVTVPLGEYQREQIAKWLKDFHIFFAEKYPHSDVVKANAHELMAPMLGLGQKLDYACVVPEGDPDHAWTGIPVSSYTPANLRALQITMALVSQGRKVILGSQLIQEAAWLTDRLTEKGITAVNFLDANGNTLPPTKRAKAVADFQEGDAQVLVATIQALRLGHNIDAASAVVVNGLPWSFDDWDQFIARAHRFTSKQQVDVYVTIPGQPPNSLQEQPTMSRRKWELLRQKGDAASLALDGRLIEAMIEEISEEEVTRQLIEAGVEATGDEIPEEDIEELWTQTPHISEFTFDPALLEGDKPEEVENPWPMMVEVLGDWTKTQAALPVTTSESNWPEWAAQIENDHAGNVRVVGIHDRFTKDYQRPPITVLTFAAMAKANWPAPPTQDATGDPVDREEGPGPAAVATPPPASGTAVIAQLKELGELHESGVLTPEEFGEMKAALIAQMKAAASHTPTAEKPEQMGLFAEEVAA
jgi:SNF2 family DNA or RNA helicase